MRSSECHFLERSVFPCQVDLVAAASTRRPRGPPPPPPTPVAPEGAEQIRRHLEELMQREALGGGETGQRSTRMGRSVDFMWYLLLC